MLNTDWTPLDYDVFGFFCCMFVTFSGLVWFYVNTALYLMSYSTFAYIRLIYTVSGKKIQKCFFVISSTKPLRLWWNLVYCFLSKYLQNHVNVFHLTRIMSLDYIVKLEILISNELHWVVRKTNSRIDFTSTNGLHIRQIWIHLITMCGNIAHERSQDSCCGVRSILASNTDELFSRQCTITKYPIKPLN